MLFIKKIEIADHEKVFLFRHKRLSAVLVPGTYRFFDPLNNIRVERFDITQHELQHMLGKFLMSSYAALTADHLHSYQLGDNEVGLVYLDGKLVDLVPPGSFKLYWKGPESVELKRVDIGDECRVADELLALLGHGHNTTVTQAAANALTYTEVEDNHVGLLSINGKQQAMLQSGSYGFWKFHRKVVVKQLDLRLQNIEVGGQEILTKDRVSLRINLSAVYRVEQPQLAVSKLSDFQDYLYRELQLQLREAVGTRSLDELLSDKNVINELVAEGTRKRINDYGLTLNSVGVRDIILPGEMKEILNQVVQAEKAAEANLIKRREETAATRSLHNTAKMMEGNPTLMHLKELEVLEKVTERIGNITVHSGLDGVLRELVKVPTALAS